MNIFTSIYKIIKAANKGYLESQEDKKNFSLRQEAIIQEKNAKALLRDQINQLLTVAIKKDIKALTIEIAPECDIYVDEVTSDLECEIISLGNHKYLLQPKEVILDD